MSDPVPNIEAAAAIRAKAIVTPEVFRNLLPELQTDAFVISGVEAFDVVQRIRDAIATVPLGADWDTTKKAIIDDLSPWLDDNPKAAENRAELLLRLHAFREYQAANHRAIMAQADVFEYCQYVCTMDGRERDTHAALHGKILPTTHPFWLNHTGPWEWGCRCEKVPLTDYEVEEIRAADDLRDPANARVLDADALLRIERGEIFTGRPDPRGGDLKGPAKMWDIRTPRERGESDFEWRAGETGMPLDEIKKRYDPEVWAAWEEWARRQKMDDGRTVWEAMSKR